MRVGSVERTPTERQTLRSVPPWCILRKANVDTLDLFVRRRVDYRNAVLVGIDDEQPCPDIIQQHRGWMLPNGDERSRVSRLRRIDHGNRSIVPARDINLRGPSLFDQV